MRRLWILALFVAPAALGGTTGSAQTCAQLLSNLSIDPVTVEIEQRRGVALYRVAGQDLPPAYAETVRPLLEHVAGNKAGEAVYFDMSRLPENRRDAFRETVKIANATLDRPRTVRFVSEIDSLFDPAARREHVDAGPVGVRTYGSRAGESYATATLRVDGMRYHLTVFSRIAEAVKAFIARLRESFTTQAPRESTIDVINRIRAQIASEYNLDPDELQIELKNQLGNTQIIDGGHTGGESSG